MSSIGIRLREERERLAMSQTVFGGEAGVTKGAQVNYENGRRSPDAEYLAKVAAVGVDVLYVLTGTRAKAQANIDADLALYADCWQALELALIHAKKTLAPEKKREAADALFELVEQGNGDLQPLATGLAKVAA